MRRSGPNMRLTHPRMTGRYDNTPESVLDWLEEQLECRGIDAVVYTRYILSLLQDYDTDDELSVDSAPSMTRRSLKRNNSYNNIASAKDNLKPVTTNKFKHKRYLNMSTTFDDFCTSSMNSDEERKLAVVQCLKSASEQELGIESFVDELCAKLKNIKVLSETPSEISVDTSVETNTSAKISPKEQAMKYYAAFPALDNNSNEEIGMTLKPTVDVVLTKDYNHNSVKWNGQKIIEFITSTNPGTEALDISSHKPDSEPNGNADATTADDRNTETGKQIDLKLGKNDVIYCEDIENDVLVRGINSIDAYPLVVANDRQNRLVKQSAFESIGDDDRFERLVNKFNSNIASIWSTNGAGDNASSKLENIWSFDSSFSSNQSSATPSPKQLAIDFWSTLGANELSQSLADKRAHPLPSFTDCWPSSLLQSYNTFPDDGFIDGNHDLIDDESNWPHFTIDKTKDESNRTTLENHQKNSPFIEFNSTLGSKSGPYGETEAQSLTKLLAAVLQQSAAHPPSPTLSEENLLTSSRTHFQPIRHDSFDRDSDDSPSVDITDTEVNKLVICSDKCPNNADHKVKDTTAGLHLRPISTSFGELASFMGPFAETDFFSIDYPTLSETEEVIVSDNTMSDKSTNTETTLNPKSRLSSILESNGESEPEYQDLYDMINEVLRNGISEEDSPLGSSLAQVTDDWYESDGGAENLPEVYGGDRQKRLSWNYYLDTYECPLGVNDHQNRTPVPSDDVFGDDLLYDDGNQLNGEDYPNYDKVFDDYYSHEKAIDGFVSEENRVYDMVGYSVSDEATPYKPQLGLQFKPRHNQANRRAQKPCTYFIEGNCKRSDCKYSHDISHITCKYWEEGFCFKAELCPFLHGYIDEGKCDGIEMTAGERTGALNYVIESDSDFPALATKDLSDETGDLWCEPEPEPVFDVEQHLLEFKAKSMAYQKNMPPVPLSKAKLPIAVFMKKKVKKRKDRNLQ